MPINPTTGDYLSGIAGSGVWLNGQMLQPGPSGYPQFWPTGYIYNCSAVNGYFILTGDGMQLSTQGAAPLYAGGGVWLAALLGGAPTARSSWGFSSQQMPLGVSPQGRIFVTIGNYPNDPYGIQGYDPDTTQPANLVENTAVMPGPANFFALDSEHAIWLEVGLTLRAGGYPTQPVTVSEGLQAQAAPMLLDWGPNGLWVAYVTQSGRGVCHPYADASQGFQAPANAFGFRVWAPSATEIELCWTGNVGETGPVTRVRYMVSQAQPLEGSSPQPPEPHPPEPQPPEPPQPIPPNPLPEPSPKPPIGVPMTIAFDLAQLGVNAVPQYNQVVTVVPHPDGNGLSALQYPSGLYASYGANWDQPKPTAGAWERFLTPSNGQGAITAYRDGGVVSAFPCVPVVVLA